MEPVFTAQLSARLPNGQVWRLELTTTPHNWRGGEAYGAPPLLKCACCGEHKSLLKHLGYVGTRSVQTTAGTYVYGIIGKLPACSACRPRTTMPLHFCHEGKLRMRMDKIRDDRGEPLRIRLEDTNRNEQRTDPWVSIDKFQLRLMEKPAKARRSGRLVIRMQPKTDRRSEADKAAAKVARAARGQKKAAQLTLPFPSTK